MSTDGLYKHVAALVARNPEAFGDADNWLDTMPGVSAESGHYMPVKPCGVVHKATDILLFPNNLWPGEAPPNTYPDVRDKADELNFRELATPADRKRWALRAIRVAWVLECSDELTAAPEWLRNWEWGAPTLDLVIPAAAAAAKAGAAAIAKAATKAAHAAATTAVAAAVKEDKLNTLTRQWVSDKLLDANRQRWDRLVSGAIKALHKIDSKRWPLTTVPDVPQSTADGDAATHGYTPSEIAERVGGCSLDRINDYAEMAGVRKLEPYIKGQRYTREETRAIMGRIADKASKKYSNGAKRWLENSAMQK